MRRLMSGGGVASVLTEPLLQGQAQQVQGQGPVRPELPQAQGLVLQVLRQVPVLPLVLARLAEQVQVQPVPERQALRRDPGSVPALRQGQAVRQLWSSEGREPSLPSEAFLR